MAATVTLATTTLAAPLGVSERHATLTSLTGIIAGETFLYLDKELTQVEQITPVSTVVLLRRGVDGTASMRHAQGTTIYLGRGDQFYLDDPQGAPPNPIPVSPYINILTGVRWGVTGDEEGPQAALRFWAPVTIATGIGSLGVRTVTTTEPS